MTLTIAVTASNSLFSGLNVETVVVFIYTVCTVEHAQFLVCTFVVLNTI